MNKIDEIKIETLGTYSNNTLRSSFVMELDEPIEFGSDEHNKLLSEMRDLVLEIQVIEVK